MGTAPNLIYTPDTNFNGNDSFTFTANDGTDTSNPATITITVRPVNDDPTITTPASLATAEGTTLHHRHRRRHRRRHRDRHLERHPGPDVDNGATSAIANLATTTITCTDNGTYTITATASDGNATATARNRTHRRQRRPRHHHHQRPHRSAPHATPATITASITDPGTNDTHTCTIDWGDTAKNTPATITPGTPGTCTATHTYTTAATHTITITTTDDDNATTTTTTTISTQPPDVGNSVPVAAAQSVDTPEDVARPVVLEGSDTDRDRRAVVHRRITTSTRNPVGHSTEPDLHTRHQLQRQRLVHLHRQRRHRHLQPRHHHHHRAARQRRPHHHHAHVRSPPPKARPCRSPPPSPTSTATP